MMIHKNATHLAFIALITPARRSCAASVLCIANCCIGIAMANLVPQPTLTSAVKLGSVEPIAPGIELFQLHTRAPLEGWVVRIDLKTPSIDLEMVPGLDDAVHRERPSQAVARLKHLRPGRRPLIAINGDMGGSFCTPVGLAVRNGILVSSAVQRSVFAWSPEKGPWIGMPSQQLRLSDGTQTLEIGGFNKPVLRETPVAYDCHWRGQRPTDPNWRELWFSGIPTDGVSPNGQWSLHAIASRSPGADISEGELTVVLPKDHWNGEEFVNKVWQLHVATRPDLSPWRTVVGGIPQVVKDGMISIADEGARASFVTGRHPRTSVGISPDRRTLVLLIIDGRRKTSVGVTLEELASIWVGLGVIEAINLDGGGSSVLWADGRIRNRPSDATGERSTASALIVSVPR